jgi:hypothetical protein
VRGQLRPNTAVSMYMHHELRQRNMVHWCLS